MLSVAIITIFVLMLISLFSGLYFLFHDNSKKHRLLTSLKLRISLAVLLISLTIYGFVTGQITPKAPWANHSSIPSSDHINEDK